ncbi:MAG: hypothetical protein ACRD3E_14330 [Terriglobales bacterium]
MKKEFVPPDAVIAELKRKAADCEQKAAKEEEPLAYVLLYDSKKFRYMAASLGSGLWTA